MSDGHHRFLSELSRLDRISRAGGEEETDAELRARLLDHYMPVGSMPRFEYDLRGTLHEFGHRRLPAGVYLGVDVKLGESFEPGAIFLIVRTETKWQRRWRLIKMWLRERWQR